MSEKERRHMTMHDTLYEAGGRTPGVDLPMSPSAGAPTDAFTRHELPARLDTIVDTDYDATETGGANG